MRDLPAAPDPGWRAMAACRGVAPALFYPEPDDEATEQTAKAVCAACPVSGPCLADALAHRERHGIWGGLNESERRQLLPARPRTTGGPCTVEGCARPAERRGWCGAHYSRWHSHGDPGPAEVVVRRPAGAPPATCTLDGCEQPVVGRGWCQLHYGRWYRRGDPGRPGAVA